MGYDLQFVDSIAASPTVRLDLKGTGWTVRVGTEFGMPELRRSAVTSMLTDGDRYPAAAYGNRLITLVLRVDGGTDDATAGLLQLLYRELDRPTNILLYRPGTTAPVFFRTFRAGPDSVVWDPTTHEVRVQVPAEPFALGLKEPLPPATVYNDPAGPAPISDSFTRSVASSWGSATSSESWVNEGGAAADHAVNGSAGTHSVTAASSSRRSSIGSAVVNGEVLVSASTDKLAAGGALLASLMLRYVDQDNLLMVQARLTTSAAVQVRIIGRVAGVEQDLATLVTVSGLTHTVGVPLRIRVQAIGTLTRAKVWLASGSEPAFWHLTALSSLWLTAGKAGVRSFADAGSTNMPVLFSYDDFLARPGLPQVGAAGVLPLSVPVWRAAAAQAGVGPVSAVVVGSSTVAGQGGAATTDPASRAVTMWGAVLRARHNTATAPGGFGVPAANLGVTNGWTRSGGANVTNRGLGFTGWQLSAGNWIERPWYGDGVTILYEQGPGAGAFTVSIDGGAATTVTPNTGAARQSGRWSSPALTVGSHTVRITGVGTCVIEAVYGHDRDRSTGVQVWNGGLPGATTSELVNTPGLITRLGEMQPALVVLAQTSNDYAAGTAPSVVKQRISDWLASLFATVSSAPQVLLVHQHERFDVVSPAYPWAQYGQILQELADADPTRVAYVDVSALFPTSQVADTSDLVDTDSTHLTERGHQVLADALAGVTADAAGAMYFDVTSPKGDVEAPLYLSVRASDVARIPESGGSGRRQSVFAVRRGGTPSAAPVVLQVESMDAVVDTAVQAVSGSSGGTVLRTSFFPQSLQVRASTSPFPSSASLDARGTYRVFVRCRKSVAADPMQMQMRYINGAASVTSDLVAVPADTVWRWVDMGLVQMPLGYDPATDGLSGTPLPVGGMSVSLYAARTSGSGTLDLDVIAFLPADDRLSLVKWPDVYTSETAYVVDPVAGQAYGMGSSGEVRAALLELIGGAPMVTPGVANRIWMLRDVGSTWSDGDDVTASVRVTPYYWPRYLTVRPVAS